LLLILKNLFFMVMLFKIQKKVLKINFESQMKNEIGYLSKY